MKRESYDRYIRRIRSRGLCFHDDEAIADRAHELLGRLIAARADRYPYEEPKDQYGLTRWERDALYGQGICPLDLY